MSLNNKAERKQAVIFPLVTRVECLSKAQSRQFDRPKKTPVSSQQKHIRKSGEMTMEQMIDLYRLKYNREEGDTLSFLPSSPHINKPRKTPPLMTSGNTCQSIGLTRNKVLSYENGRGRIRRSQLVIDNSKALPPASKQQKLAKTRRKQLRRHLNILIKRNSVNMKKRYTCNTDTSVASPRYAQESKEESFNGSFEQLKLKLLEEEYINTHIVQFSYPGSSRMENPSESLKLAEFLKKNAQNSKEKSEQKGESNSKKVKKYIDTTIEELCCQQKYLEDKNGDFFLKVNTKTLSSRPFPTLTPVIREYKPRKPQKEQGFTDQSQVSGWGEEQFNIHRLELKK